jgi:hypothetical protein
MIVEILDGDRPLARENGELVVTDLNNLALPRPDRVQREPSGKMVPQAL